MTWFRNLSNLLHLLPIKDVCIFTWNFLEAISWGLVNYLLPKAKDANLKENKLRTLTYNGDNYSMDFMSCFLNSCSQHLFVSIIYYHVLYRGSS